MIRGAKTLIVALCLVAGLLGCTESKATYGMQVDESEISGPGTLGLTVPGQPVRGIVVYFHGADQTARVIADDRRHTDLFDPLLRSGYAVVAADAGDNAFGNPTSLNAYRKLIAAARDQYRSANLFFVAESMGALAALGLIREDTDRQVKGMAGISPLMGLPPEASGIDFVARAWGGNVPVSADPLEWAPESFANRKFRLYASSTDEVIPPIASARAFADKFGSVADIELLDCEGGHVALPCYQAADVTKWISELS